jgi:hypothetical protein
MTGAKKGMKDITTTGWRGHDLKLGSHKDRESFRESQVRTTRRRAMSGCQTLDMNDESKDQCCITWSYGKCAVQ